jgi:hypothetical protein
LADVTRIKIEAPNTGEKNTVAEPKVDTALRIIETYLNGQELDGEVNIKNEGIKEANLTKELREKLAAKIGLTIEKRNESLEGVSEKLYFMEKNGSTLTLPAPTANRIIGVFGNAPSGMKVSTSTGLIYGDFVEGAKTVTIPFLYHCRFVANGEAWVIDSGVPKLESIYSFALFTKTGAEAGTTPSTTRPSFVTVAAKTGTVEVEYAGGGTEVGVPAIGFYLPAGRLWKANGECYVSTLLL